MASKYQRTATLKTALCRLDPRRAHHSTSLIKFDQCRPRFDARTTGFFAVEDKVRAEDFKSENPLLLKRSRNSDFTRVFSGCYPILERFEPIGSPCQKTRFLFLQSLLLTHQPRFFDRECFAVDQFIQK